MLTTRVLLLSLSLLGAPLVLSARAEEEKDHPVIALVKSKVKDPSKPFALLVTIKAKAGKEKDLEATFAPCLAATKKEPGCIAYELNRDTEDPQVYLMFEKFKSVTALNEHLKQEHTKKLLKALEPLTAGELKVKVYSVPQ